MWSWCVVLGGVCVCVVGVCGLGLVCGVIAGVGGCKAEMGPK